MGRDPGEQGARRVVAEPAPGQTLGRAQGGQAEPGHRQRVARDVRHRPQDLRTDLGHVAHQRPEQPPPGAPVRAAQALAGDRDGPLEDGRPSAVERVRDRRIGMDDLDAVGGQVDRGEERRRQRQRQDRRAHVVAEPGQRQLHGPRPAAGLRGGLVDADRAPGTGQRDGRGQPVRPGPDDDRVDRRLARRRHRVTPGGGAIGRGVTPVG